MQLLLIILNGLSLTNGIFQFRVMSWNVWQCGKNVENGPVKIARHIEMSMADLVVLQQMEGRGCVGSVKKHLKPEWYYSGVTNEGLMIISKFQIIESTVRSAKIVHAKLLVPNDEAVDLFAFYADRASYGPYDVQAEVPNLATIMAQEKIRIQDAKDLVDFVRSRNMPQRRTVIIAGQVNSPSHQDWISANKDLHNGQTIAWPTTKVFTDAGYIDSFRQLHVDPIKKPGLTWSACVPSNSLVRQYPIQEPYDRIDYIYYRQGINQIIKPIKSETYAGTGKIKMLPHQKKNNWPAAHYAIITDFVLYSPTGSDTNSRVNDL